MPMAVVVMPGVVMPIVAGIMARMIMPVVIVARVVVDVVIVMVYMGMARMIMPVVIVVGRIMLARSVLVRACVRHGNHLSLTSLATDQEVYPQRPNPIR